MVRSLGNAGIKGNGVGVPERFWLPTYSQRTWPTHGLGVGVAVGVGGTGVGVGLVTLTNSKPRAVWTVGVNVGVAVGVAIGVPVGVGVPVGLGYTAKFRLPR